MLKSAELKKKAAEAMKALDEAKAAEAEAKEARKVAQRAEAKEAEMPANGGLFANAKISADALKKLQDTED